MRFVCCEHGFGHATRGVSQMLLDRGGGGRSVLPVRCCFLTVEYNWCDIMVGPKLCLAVSVLYRSYICDITYAFVCIND